MMRVIGFILACAATPATALSCLAPNPAMLYQHAAQAEEAYLPVVGAFDFKIPERNDDTSNTLKRQSQTVSAQFTGMALTSQGFQAPYDTAVEVTFSCASVWCGSMRPNALYLAALKKTADGLFLDVGPCGGWVLSDPSPAQIKTFEACHMGGACAADQ